MSWLYNIFLFFCFGEGNGLYIQTSKENYNNIIYVNILNRFIFSVLLLSITGDKHLKHFYHQ